MGNRKVLETNRKRRDLELDQAIEKLAKIQEELQAQAIQLAAEDHAGKALD